MPIPEDRADHIAQINDAKLASPKTIKSIAGLIEALMATGNRSASTGEFDAFSAAAVKLAGIISAHGDRPILNQDILESISTVATYAGMYLESREKLRSPSSTQKKRMEIARKFREAAAAVNESVASEFTMEEVEAASVWYDSFKELLAAQGIDLNNPYSLGRVVIMHDTEMDVDKEPGELPVEDFLNEFKEGGKLFSYAFMGQRSDGSYDVPRTKDGADIKWIRDNMQNPAKLSDVDIIRLYRSAKDCRLYLHLPTVGSEKADTPQSFFVDTEGRAGITPKGAAIFPDVYNNVKIDHREIKMSDEDFHKIFVNDDRRQNVVVALESFSENLSNVEFEDVNDYHETHNSLTKESVERNILANLSINPSWAETDEQIEYLEKSAGYMHVPNRYVTDDMMKYAKTNFTFTENYNFLMKTLEKRFGTRNTDTLMKSGKIRRADGTPFSTNDSLKFINEVYIASMNGEGVYLEYEKEGETKRGVFTQNGDMGLMESFNIRDMDLRARQLRLAMDEARREDLSPSLGKIMEHLDHQIDKDNVSYRSGHYCYVPFNLFEEDARLIADECSAYVKSLPKDAPLSPAQIKTLKLIAETQVYCATALNLSLSPTLRDDVKNRIATAMVCDNAAELLGSEKPEDVERGRLLLTDEAAAKQAVDELMASENFRSATDGKSDAELEDLRVSHFVNVPHISTVEKTTELSDARMFVEELATQLKAMGYDNPLAMAQICVREDSITAARVNDALNDNTPAGITEAYRLIDESQQYALIERDENGAPVNPRLEGESRADWIKRTVKPAESMSDGQAVWLYRAAKEGRLILKPDSTGANLDAPSYILVGKNGAPLMGKTLQEISNDPAAFGFTNDRIDEIKVSEEEKGSMEVTSRMILGGAGMRFRNKLNMADSPEKEQAARRDLEEFKRVEADCFEEYYLRDLTAMAHSHRSWFADPKDAAVIQKVIGLPYKPQETLTSAEKKLMEDNPAISEDGTLLEKGILKRTGCKTVEEIRLGGKITDRSGKVITAESDLKFINKLIKTTASEELFIDGKAFRMVPSVGLEKGFDRKGYADQAKYISDMFRKSGIRAAEAGDNYAMLSELMAGLPEKIRTLHLTEGDPQTELKGLLIHVTAVGDAYIRGLEGNLTGPQLRCVKALNRLRDLRDQAIAGESHPEKGTEDKLAEKVATAYAIKHRTHPKAHEYMTDPSSRKRVIEALKEQPAFKKLLAECKKAGLDKVMRVSGEKLCAQCEKYAQVPERAGDVRRNEQKPPVLG
ncbi:MAG: hypothetical protein MJ194_05350 [Clostridia bacterium]|nr:hypothetical protein [Clostridia bacterium]